MTKPSLSLTAALMLAACGTTKPAATTAEITPEQAREAAIQDAVVAAIDTDTDPCDDFYQYACGTWLEETEIPADQARWSRSFSVIYNNNLDVLRSILEEQSGDSASQLGAYYGACMDEEASEARGAQPLMPYLEKIRGVDSVATLMAVLPQLPMTDAFFSAFVMADFKDPDTNVLHMSQGGLGLPERGYYFPSNDQGAMLLADYEVHIAKMLEAIGFEASRATAAAKNVVAVETLLADASRSPADLRDVESLHHRMDRAGLEAHTPWLNWGLFFQVLGAPDLQPINVMTPEFFDGMKKVTKKGDWQAVQDYLTWSMLRGTSSHLAPSLAKADFEFYGKRLSGQEQMQPRWKRCVRMTDGAMGDALGEAYVAREFGGDSKDIALDMIHRVEDAFESGLGSLAWMDHVTQDRAKEKLDAITNKIGFPDEWESYADLQVSGGHFGNAVASWRFEMKKDLDKVGKPVDPTEWYMSPPTVNAYYNPSENEIVFPAGILQPPFFSADFPAAMNFGAMGMVMGHEITHGFDDEGRKFSPDGSLKTWWEPEASEAFEEAATCVDDLYSSFEVQPGVFVNGKLTLGENIADMGGIRLAHTAYNGWVTENGAEAEVAGYTGEQLLFLSFAQGWCTKARPELERMRVATDPHSPPKFRVNGPLAHFPEFGEAFSCEVGSAMRPEKTCTVW